MSPRKKLLLWLAPVTVVLGLAVNLWLDREPHFRGRPLSEWVLGNSWWGNKPRATISQREQDEAIQKIGVKGLPYLVRWMNYESYGFRWRLFNRLPTAVSQKLRTQPLGNYERGVFWFECRREYTLARRAYEALLSLGPAATPAIPELAKLAATWPSRRAERAVYIMGAIGPAAVPAFTNLIAVTATNKLKAELIAELGRLGFVATTAIPALLDYLRDPDPEIAARSAEALGTIGQVGQHSKVVVVALTDALNRPEPLVREQAALALGEFGGEAKAAIGKLRGLSSGTKAEAAAVLTALRKIAPNEFWNSMPNPFR